MICNQMLGFSGDVSPLKPACGASEAARSLDRLGFLQGFRKIDSDLARDGFVEKLVFPCNISLSYGGFDRSLLLYPGSTSSSLRPSLLHIASLPLTAEAVLTSQNKLHYRFTFIKLLLVQLGSNHGNNIHMVFLPDLCNNFSGDVRLNHMKIVAISFQNLDIM